ncbi:MAG: hypothetical protein IKX44_04440 [Prevotella sp.]|nr:hypothetical protein [Prevotella sp.]
MKKEYDIRTLTERFFDGETTLAEEQRLYELYRQAESLPADLLPFREMMLDLETLPQSSQEEGVSTPLLCREGQGRGSHMWLSLAASLLLFFTLGSMWYGYQRQNECVAYVYGERVTDRELVMQEMQTAMVSLASDDATATMEQQMKELFSN